MKGTKTLHKGTRTSDATAPSVKKKNAKKSDPWRHLKKSALTKEKAHEFMNMRMLVDGIIAHNKHILIYGASGAFKTTLACRMALDMAADGLDIHYWSFDPTMQQAAALERVAREDGIGEKMTILADSTISEFLEAYEDADDEELDMSNVVVILDTFKFLTKNVNDKNANKEAMHFVKNFIQVRGGTCVTLAHTNKDGKDNSGTAELEQDGDAMLRIDATKDETTNTATVTIKEGKRVRYIVKPTTFTIDITANKQYPYTTLKSAARQAKSVDIDKVNAEVEMLKTDRNKLEIFCQVLHEAGGSMTMNDMHAALSYAYSSKTTIVNTVDKWDGRAWDKTKEMVDNNMPNGGKRAVMVVTLNEAFVLKHGLSW